MILSTRPFDRLERIVELLFENLNQVTPFVYQSSVNNFLQGFQFDPGGNVDSAAPQAPGARNGADDFCPKTAKRDRFIGQFHRHSFSGNASSFFNNLFGF